MLIIRHRFHDLDEINQEVAFDGAEIDIRTLNGELIVEHDPFKSGPKLLDWLTRFRGGFIIANVKEEGLEPYIVQMLSDANIKNYFILDESVPLIIKNCKAGNPNFGIRVSKWEPAIAAIKIMEHISPSPKWIWLDTFDAHLPIENQELVDLVSVGAKICLVSPELHSDYEGKHPTKDFMRAFEALGIENFEAVCTKQPAFWNDFKKNKLVKT